MDADDLKRMVDQAAKATRDLEEPLRSIAFKSILERLLTGGAREDVMAPAPPQASGPTPIPSSGAAESAEVPQITASGLVEAILQLLRSPWGKHPKTLREIEEALRINAIHYPQASIATRLMELTKRGKLRRLKKDGLLAYVYSGKD